VPLPPPAKATFKERDGGGINAKVALTETEDVDRVTTHEPAPLQPPPLQPENVLPLLGAALRVTWEPCGNVPEQLPLEQDTPPGLLLTVPLPLIEIDNKLSGPVIALDTSRLGGLSFPEVSKAVTEK
jgi:hypothetical protein